MTKNIFLFKLLFISIITLFICSCTSRSKTNEDTQKDTTSAHTYTPSINVDSLAATIDTSSYSNMNRDNEDDDEDMDDDEDDEDFDEDDYDEDYDDPYSQRTRHATATYYKYDGLGRKIRHDVNVDVDVQNGRVTRVYFPDDGIYPSGTDLSDGYLDNGKTHVATDVGYGYDITLH